MWEHIERDAETAEPDGTAYGTRIRQSRERCGASRIGTALVGPLRHADPDELQPLLDQHATLTAYTRLLFGEIYRHLSDASQLLVLTDPQGHVLQLYSDPRVVDTLASRCGLRCGVSMAEDSIGTNAFALVVHDRVEARVRGTQHYAHILQELDSAAAPVTTLDGGLAACVGILSANDGPRHEDLALASCMARELDPLVRQSHPASTPKGPVSSLDHARPSSKRANGIQLTRRQHEVLGLFAEGLSYKEIARRLSIGSVKTVEEHLEAVRVKLGATSRRGCIQRAVELDLLLPD